jgi:hypothetical protein
VEVGIGHANGGIVGHIQLATGPGAVRAGAADESATAHVVQRCDNQSVARGGGLTEALARSGRINHNRLKVRGVLSRLGQVHGDQRALAQSDAVDRPVLGQAHNDLAIHHRLNLRFMRQRQLGHAGAGQEIIFFFKCCQWPIDDDGAMPGPVMQRNGGDPVSAILGRAAKNLLRVLERLAALEPPDHIGVTRACQFSGIERAGHEQRVLVFPCDPLFGPRQLKPILDESRRRQIKFPYRDCVFAAIGQIDHAAMFCGFDKVCAFPEPVPFLGFGQCIKIKHRSPLRGITLVTFQGGAPPYSMNMVRILPKIENFPTDHARRRNAVLRLRDRQRIRIQTGIARVLFQNGQRLVVLGVDPLHGLGAINTLQPDIRIIQRRLGKHRYGGRNYRQNHQTEKLELAWQTYFVHAPQYPQMSRRYQACRVSRPIRHGPKATFVGFQTLTARLRDVRQRVAQHIERKRRKHVGFFNRLPRASRC